MKVEYAAIETGLGGRLDATNLITPKASIITSISMEHTEFLGNSIEKIAYEKAGIIKADSEVFVGIMPKEAEEVIAKTAELKNCGKYFIKDFIEEKEDSLILKLLTMNYHLDSTPLHGRHQLLNAALAIKSYSTVINDENQRVISDGINNVVENTGIQGRYEVFKDKPRIIFDSAHNPEGVKIFVNEFSRIYKKYSKRVVIFTALRDKAIFEMLTILAPYFTDFYVTSVKNERALTIEELLKLCKSLGLRAKPLANPEMFIKKFEKEENEDCLAILGSRYLIGELKEKISKNA
jgi:dihydrofolate synthase/folylpolyglutamate synthase